MKYIVWRKSIAGLLIFACVEITSAQIIRVGAKVGPQMSWFAVDDPKYNSVASVRPMVGFHAGLVVAFK
ncbi:MAG TPA: hypothetical protein VFZ52_22850, partial [Chryseolinea sp.]